MLPKFGSVVSSSFQSERSRPQASVRMPPASLTISAAPAMS